jgi:predicted adenine nucleotide alpha hydrolase (AANH) superfamily ATPase
VPVPALMKDGFDVVAFFFNPNIHPFLEFRNRLTAMEQFAKNMEVTTLFFRGYPLEDFLQAQVAHLDARCEACYEIRLSATAEKAKEEGATLFSTTMLVSPYQKHDLLQEVGRRVQRKTGVEFFYADWRSRYRETRTLAREQGLYFQKYCGCIFSEKERYFRERGG